MLSRTALAAAASTLSTRSPSGEVPSTKTIVELLNGIATSKHVLIVLERGDELSYKSVRNIPTVHVLPFDQLNAYDVLVSDDIVFTKGAFDAFVA